MTGLNLHRQVSCTNACLAHFYLRIFGIFLPGNSNVSYAYILLHGNQR
jgi:hypothetical protein